MPQIQNIELRALLVLINSRKVEPWDFPYSICDIVFALRNKYKIRHTRGLKKYIVDIGDIPDWDEDTMTIVKQLMEIS